MVTGPQFDHAAYDAVLFIDSMIPLEGRPLPELPWQELGLGQKVLLLVVPQVLQEVDKRKRDGRLGKRAREFRRLVEPAALAGAPIRLVDGPPVVDLALAPSSRIDWDKLDDLDPDEGDAKVVAQILHERGVPDERKMLFSHDMLPIALASRRGLSVRRFPDEWLAPSEPSPHDKEVTKLKARVRELEMAEPDVNATITFGVSPPVELPVVEPLSREEQSELYDLLLRQNPRQGQQSPALMGGYGYDTECDGKYQKYVDETLPAYMANLHKLVQDYHAVRATNSPALIKSASIHPSRYSFCARPNLAPTTDGIRGSMPSPSTNATHCSGRSNWISPAGRPCDAHGRTRGCSRSGKSTSSLSISAPSTQVVSELPDLYLASRRSHLVLWPIHP